MPSRVGGIHSAQWPGVLLDHLACLNSTQAAIRAGYSEKTANEQGSQNLAKLSVANRIAELNSERLERVQIATFT
uniref:terminase small subunit n=1 Tax=Edwardsiella tarda TaxID=636 RepID=UPI00402ABCC6